MDLKQLESIMAAVYRGECYSQVLRAHGVTDVQVRRAIDDEIAHAERQKTEAMMRLIKHRQSKVQ